MVNHANEDAMTTYTPELATFAVTLFGMEIELERSRLFCARRAYHNEAIAKHCDRLAALRAELVHAQSFIA